MATISDKRLQHSTDGTAIDYFDADVQTAQEYYAFGSIVPGRTYLSPVGGVGGGYRYGFNGKENDNDVKKDGYGNPNIGTQQDYGDRIYDPRLGRWLSVDAYASLQPGWSPFRFGFDNPLYWTDKDGDIEWPLKGTYAINMHDRIWRKGQNELRSGQIVKQEGFYSGKLSKDYLTNMNANTILRTSAYNTFREGGPVNKKNYMTSPHVGTDYRAQTPVNIYSLGDGIVSDIGKFRNGTNFIEVTYKNGDRIRFLHLNDFTEGLKKNEKVYEGQILGKTGSTGAPGQPHLHVDGKDKFDKSIDPEKSQYGTITNEEFFNKYNGDYKKLEGYKRDHPQTHDK